MARVTGFGGAFLRAENPAVLYAWYKANLGLEGNDAGFAFDRATQHPHFAIAFFPKASTYFPPAQPAMLNFQVDDLDGLLDRLALAGVVVDPKRESCEYGRFGWFTDPEGNRVELWQPPV